MAKGPSERKAVLVLPDVGLSEEQIQSLKEEFSNSLVASLRKAGLRVENFIIIVVVVVILAE